MLLGLLIADYFAKYIFYMHTLFLHFFQLSNFPHRKCITVPKRPTRGVGPRLKTPEAATVKGATVRLFY